MRPLTQMPISCQKMLCSGLPREKMPANSVCSMNSRARSAIIFAPSYCARSSGVLPSARARSRSAFASFVRQSSASMTRAAVSAFQQQRVRRRAQVELAVVLALRVRVQPRVLQPRVIGRLRASAA
jgi:hypothetical protein